MATAAKRQLALSAALWKELNQLARREGKSTVAVLQDLVLENKHNRLGQEFRTIQGYWSKKAKAKGILTARDLHRYLAKP
jgi:predicted DNA-binding ribbon-helix-helix protein